MAYLSYFSDSSISDGQYVTSFADLSEIVHAIQADSSDSYFDATSKIDKVFVYYTQEDGRQVKRVDHVMPNLEAWTSWPEGARDGIWQKTKIKVFDHDRAEHTLNRDLIGSGEDTTHSSEWMYLNTI